MGSLRAVAGQVAGIPGHDRRRRRIDVLAALRLQFVDERLVDPGGGATVADAPFRRGILELAEQRGGLVLGDIAGRVELADVLDDALRVTMMKKVTDRESACPALSVAATVNVCWPTVISVSRFIGCPLASPCPAMVVLPSIVDVTDPTPAPVACPLPSSTV